MSVTVGQINPDYGVGQRDAVHMPCVLVWSSVNVYPSQRMKFCNGDKCQVEPEIYTPHGIVDPFLTNPVTRVQKFWLFLLPGKISDLVHEFHIYGVDDKVHVVPAPIDEIEDDAYDDCQGCNH